MTDYTNLVRALRYCVKARNCEKCAYRINNNSVKCRVQRVEDAADAIVALGLDNEDYEHENRRLHGEIEALQAEQKKTVTQIFGEEQMAWEGRCKDLMKHISDLQAEIGESMQKCAECGDAQEQKVKELQDKVFELEEELNDADIAADDNGRQIKEMAKCNAELHSELEKWVSAAEQAGEPKQRNLVEIVRCKDCYWNQIQRFGNGKEYCECSRGNSRINNGDWFCPEGEKMEVQDGQKES